jgi:hypothetical protein
MAADPVLCIRRSLQIQQLVDHFIGGEPIEEWHDTAGEFEVRGAAIRHQNAGMSSLCLKGLGVELFKINTVMGEHGSLVFHGILQLCGI